MENDQYEHGGGSPLPSEPASVENVTRRSHVSEEPESLDDDNRVAAEEPEPLV